MKTKLKVKIEFTIKEGDPLDKAFSHSDGSYSPTLVGVWCKDLSNRLKHILCHDQIPCTRQCMMMLQDLNNNDIGTITIDFQDFSNDYQAITTEMSNDEIIARLTKGIR